MQTEEPAAAENLPSPQSEHVLTAVAPTAAEYFPASQLMQTDEPAVAEYFPASQLVQTDEPDVGEYFPAMQSVHTD